MLFVSLNFIGCTDLNPPSPDGVEALHKLETQEVAHSEVVHPSDASMEGDDIIDCDFDADMHTSGDIDCEEVENVVDRIIDLPGYCKLKVSYKIYHCDYKGTDLYVIQDLDWTWTVPDCFGFNIQLIQNCQASCPPNDQTCFIQCLTDAYTELERVLYWWISDDYLGQPDRVEDFHYTVADCPYAGGPAAVQMRFELKTCYQWCFNPITGGGWNRGVCGIGCCVYQGFYCANTDGSLSRFTSTVTHPNTPCGTQVVNCDGVPINECVVGYCGN